ncbi:hypothetical protein PV762_25955 [Mitsuaria sp. CC2]|uniref:hypothetical protein n=1 Tax=Mitsuaria sp. CC2 TaxID=3029186 RepID=UPI003B8E404E
MISDEKDLLERIPAGVDYTDEPAELDFDDIPRERIPRLEHLLVAEDEYVRLRAGLLLASWGEKSGFEFLRLFVEISKGKDLEWFPHRLRLYDETYTRIFMALESFWAKSLDANINEELRTELVLTLRRLIEYASVLQFEVPLQFLLLHAKLIELLPDVRNYLHEILKNREFHHWKVEDAISVLKQVDPDFVAHELARHGGD